MPNVTLRHDWQPAAFGVRQLALDFTLGEGETRVQATLDLVRQAPGPLVLQGAGLEILSLALDGRAVAPRIEGEDYHFADAPDRCTLQTLTRLYPERNQALEGLYRSNGTFCTQCEAQGFRKITLYPDRPDVMAPMRVRIEADCEAAPVLLSNGNPAGAGDLPGGRHYALWEDPFPKSSYLFALVAGRLGHIEDSFRTRAGREVRLCIHAAPDDLGKLDLAMASLRRAMAWDEEVYGREYQYSVFNIVAIADFNMGAMENTSLNIFNTKYVLAGMETATDADMADVERVIAHEYFHNWSGNRVTCRDWFQLSLKEGLTVFRDQCFSADHFGGAIKRIQDVETLRRVQFPEDAGPTAHPVRPDSYIEINNFYTPTVYEKGAELVRMARTILGERRFRLGTDLYFARHDGQAVTCDDFVTALEDASGEDLSQFRHWYGQAGTPEVSAETAYDAVARRFTLTLSQETPPTPGQSEKAPLHIPIRVALLDRAGGAPLSLDGEGGSERVLHLKAARQSFDFAGVAAPPVVSLLRGFSAPVKLKIAREPADLALLMAHESDPFSRWDAAQQLGLQGLQSLLAGANTGTLEPLLQALESVLAEAGTLRLATPAELTAAELTAAMIRLPDEAVLAQLAAPVDAEAVHRACRQARRLLAQRLKAPLLAAYRASSGDGPAGYDEAGIARRALRNAALAALMADPDDEVLALAERQARTAQTMTEKIAALRLLAEHDGPAREALLADFYQRYRAEPLVIDKWFAIQAAAHRPRVLEEVRALMDHPDFTLANPNRLRALIGSYSAGNFPGFHRRDGAGYELLAEIILKLDGFNPQIAARLIGPLRAWRRFAAPWGEPMAQALRRIQAAPGLSADCDEVVSKSLA